MRFTDKVKFLEQEIVSVCGGNINVLKHVLRHAEREVVLFDHERSSLVDDQRLRLVR